MLGSNAEAQLAEKRVLLRITLIGASGSGKTSLVSSFVNNSFQDKYQPTENLTLYYASLSMASSEDDPTGPKFNTLLEIEDTPGSEKMDKLLLHLFDPYWPKPMELATEKPPKECLEPKDKGPNKRVMNVHLPFSHSEAPLANKNDEGKEVLHDPATGRFICKPAKGKKGNPKGCGGKDPDAQCPSCMRLQAAILPTGLYQPLVRQRMAYLFVFDANDDKSYVEALKRYKDFKAYQEKKADIIKQLPLIYLVGSKMDKDPLGTTYQEISEHVRGFAREESEAGSKLMTAKVSSLQYRGVLKLFRNIVQDLRTREPLWKLHPLGEGASTEAGEKGCELQ